MKKTIALVTSILLLAVGFTAYGLFAPVVSKPKGVVYYIKAGTSKKTLAAELANEGIIPFPRIFALYLYLRQNTHLKTGEYLFPKGSTPISIWRQVTSGTGLYYRAFTIIPGWTFTQLKEALAKTDTLRHFSANLTDAQVMQQLGYTNTQPEGQFFPETYYYTRDVVDIVILKRAADLMQKRLQEAWENRLPGLPYKDREAALTAASLVEKEAYLASERPIIAGVLINRLHKNMLLQIDPTVIYGMGTRYQGKIHKQDLRENTPYNTYVHKGLPPSPIAMPSMASINAVMHPIHHDYYYFVARGDGSHQFSKTLPEHNAAVAASIKKQVSYFNKAQVKKYINLMMSKNNGPRKIYYH